VFEGVQFGGDAVFEGVQFGGDAQFEGAHFSGQARFDKAQFSGQARFYKAQFSEYARFDKARLDVSGACSRLTRIVVTGSSWLMLIRASITEIRGRGSRGRCRGYRSR
jgi:hypothetical protein